MDYKVIETFYYESGKYNDLMPYVDFREFCDNIENAIYRSFSKDSYDRKWVRLDTDNDSFEDTVCIGITKDNIDILLMVVTFDNYGVKFYRIENTTTKEQWDTLSLSPIYQ